MRLLAVGCSYKSTPVELRERLAFDGDKLPRALEELQRRFECEAVILSTCNRVELYLAQVLDHRQQRSEVLDAEQAAQFLAEFHGLPPAQVRPHMYVHEQRQAVHHLFRVSASLDSMVVGEDQIAGQVKTAYELGCMHNSVGPILHALFRQARETSRRVRTETSISRGRVSIPSAAVDYVRQVFDHFGDKTILVIGAGEMGEATLKHLTELHPGHILITNRSPEKAQTLARDFGGKAVPWEELDNSLALADIVLSTTGAPEPIVTMKRHKEVLARRKARGCDSPMVVLDIAVPRDFDAGIHDGDRTFLFNIDDLQRICDATLADRLQHVEPAEAIVVQEVNGFLADSARRKTGPVIARLTQDFEAKREAITRKLFSKLNGKLTPDDCAYIMGAFRQLQNQFLHGPIRTLADEVETDSSPHDHHTLLDAFLKLFRLQE